jgi:hypothetical protein
VAHGLLASDLSNRLGSHRFWVAQDLLESITSSSKGGITVKKKLKGKTNVKSVKVTLQKLEIDDLRKIVGSASESTSALSIS